MKLAYIANVRMPTEKAHGVQIMEMCAAFASAGAELTLVVPWRFNKLKADPFQYYGVPRSFKIVKVPALDVLPVLRGRIGFLIEQFSFYVIAKLYVRSSKFDAIYGRDVVAPLFFKDSYFEVHNMPERQGKLFGWVINRAKHLFPVTGHLKDALITAGAPTGKITVVPDGVNLSMFQNRPEKEAARERLNLPVDRKIVVYTGSFYLYSWKGVDVLLETSGYFSADTLFVLVGGDEKEIADIKKKGVGPNVRLVPHRPHHEVAGYLAAADVLVLPNKTGSLHSERYTSPLKLFEYMASGVPIVASHLPSICEVLNENNAFLVTANSPERLAAGLRMVLLDARGSRERADQALKDVKKYSWDERAVTIINKLDC